MQHPLAPSDRRVPWLETLRLGAPVRPLKHAVDVNPDALPESTDPDRNLRYVDIGNVDASGRILATEELSFANAPSRARRLPRRGDTILSTVRTYLRAVAYVDNDDQDDGDQDLVCSTGFAVVRSRGDLAPKYLYYWLRSDPLIDEICARSVGVSYPAFNASELGSLPVPMLPIAEQRRIADFLDRKTAVIDDLIAKKERLVALLAEKRQGFITQLVTKGLDPTAPVRDSGVEWIGTVPAHWDVLPLKHLSPRISGRLVFKPAQYFVDEGVPFLMGNNITEDGVVWTNLKYVTSETNARFAHHALRTGDVVMVRVGAPGVTCVVPQEAAGLNCGSMMIVRQSPLFVSDWLGAALNSHVVRAQIDLVQYGAAQEQINIGDAIGFLLPVPPIPEQYDLARALSSGTRQIRDAVGTIERSIDLLREYRQALITAAVTGQLDPASERAVAAHDDSVAQAGV